MFAGETINNPLGVPAPNNFSVLLTGTPEEIIKQYISMHEKTDSYIEYAKATRSMADFGPAMMRYAAGSSVCIYGVNLFIALDKLDVKKLEPEKLNNLIYGKLLFDISDFSWLLLQYTFNNHALSQQFGKENIAKFLGAEHTPELYWTMVFGYLAESKNADFAYQSLRSYVAQLEALDPKKLDNLPSDQTKLAFKQMLEAGLIGDPNKYRLFDAKNMINILEMGPWELEKHRKQIVNSEIVKMLEPEIKLHLLSNF